MLIVEIGVLAGSVVVDSIATNCCKAITKKKIKPNVKKELKKFGNNPSEEEVAKATKRAARKCMLKRLTVNSIVSAGTIVGTSVVATNIINNYSSTDTDNNESVDDNPVDVEDVVDIEVSE